MKANNKSIKKGIKISIYVILYSLLACIVALILSVCVQKYIQKKAVPTLFGYSTLIVETGSMNGTIDEGDFIVIHKEKTYRLGEIVTYIHKGEKVPTTHRIVNYDSEGNFITKGDANNAVDSISVKPSEIIGKVVKQSRALGLFVQWFKYENGYIYGIAMLAIVVIGGVLLKKPNKEESGEEKNESGNT